MAEALPVPPARPADLPRIAQLLTQAGLPALHLDGEGVQLFALSEGGELLGCIGCESHGSAVLLRSLAVAPAARGRGLGGSLLRTVLEAARRRGATQVVLLTLDAAAFFEGQGFERVERAAVDPALLESWEFVHHACDEAHCLRHRL